MRSEFQFIENLKKKYSLTKIGDDCAVLPKDSLTDLVITTDLLVEDIDFRLDWSKPEFIGHKSLAVSLSDVAAMGAKPVWSMVSVGVPEHIWKTDFVDRFYDGYMRLAKKFDVELVGGDVSKTPDKIVIDSIAAGEVKKGKAVLRSGAKVGDLIFVSGELGGAAGGLKLLENEIYYNDFAKIWQKNLLLKQLQPLPHIYAAQDLNDENQPTAMIDLSDGLSSDLTHLCRASKVGAKIYSHKIPVNKNLKTVTATLIERLNYALNGGEDFELLFTANPQKKIQLKNAHEKRGFTYIGEITANKEIIELITDEKSHILEPKGFRHF
jgi:thiamine-monophosphate kinase